MSASADIVNATDVWWCNGVVKYFVTQWMKVKMQEKNSCCCNLIQFFPEHLMLKSYDD